MAGHVGATNLNRIKIEKRKLEKYYQPFMDKIYKVRGYSYRRITGKDNIKGDVQITHKDGKSLLIEEKGVDYYYPELPCEVWEDRPSKTKGWLQYCESDYLFWIYCVDWQINNKPLYIYKVNMERLIKHLKEYRYKRKITNRGYGVTENIHVTWDNLIDKKIAVDFYDRDEPYLEEWFIDDERKTNETL